MAKRIDLYSDKELREATYRVARKHGGSLGGELNVVVVGALINAQLEMMQEEKEDSNGWHE